MYKKILVPLDGSEMAEQVLPHVIQLAHCTGAEIILMRVPSMPSYDYLVTDPLLLHEIREQAESESAAYLARMRKELTAEGLKVDVHADFDGAVYTTILEAAQELNVDLIAMSTHGRSGLGRLVLGSVADQIVRHATSPVLLVHPKAGQFQVSVFAHSTDTPVSAN